MGSDRRGERRTPPGWAPRMCTARALGSTVRSEPRGEKKLLLADHVKSGTRAAGLCCQRVTRACESPLGGQGTCGSHVERMEWGMRGTQGALRRGRRAAWISVSTRRGRANHSQSNLIASNTPLSEREDPGHSAASPPRLPPGGPHCAEEHGQSPTLGNVWSPDRCIISAQGVCTLPDANTELCSKLRPTTPTRNGSTTRTLTQCANWVPTVNSLPFDPQRWVSHWAGVTPIKAAWRMSRGLRTGNRI